jgi:hypothetical protein
MRRCRRQQPLEGRGLQAPGHREGIGEAVDEEEDDAGIGAEQGDEREMEARRPEDEERGGDEHEADQRRGPEQRREPIDRGGLARLAQARHRGDAIA